MNFASALQILATLVALASPALATAQLSATGNANGTADGGASGAPALPFSFVEKPPSLVFSMRVDGGALVRGVPQDAEFDFIPDLGVVQGTATVSLGSETRIGGFYTELGFAGGTILEGDDAYSASLNAMYQRPWGWFRLGGGLGGAYHALGRGVGQGFDHTGELLARIEMEIDPLTSKIWNPYVGLSGQFGVLFGEQRLGASYAAGAALGFRFSDW